MDRFGHILDNLRKLMLGLNERRICVQFLKENLVFTGEYSPMANLLFRVMSAFSIRKRGCVELSPDIFLLSDAEGREDAA